MPKQQTAKQQTAKQPAKRTRHLYGAAIIGMLIIVLAGTWWYFNGPNLQLSSTFPANSAEQKDSIEELKQPTNPNDITDAHNNIFKIPELGIQFVLPEGLEGLEYEMREWNSIDNSGNTTKHTSPYFVTDLLREKDLQCSYGAIGVISKIPPSLMESDSPIPSKYKRKMGENYYIFNGPPQPCSLDEAANSLQSSQINLLLGVLKVAELSRD